MEKVLGTSGLRRSRLFSGSDKMDRPTMSSHDEELNVDFEYLAMVDADFAAVYKQGEGRIDYQDPQHQR